MFGMTIIVMKNKKPKRSPRASFQVHHTSRPPCQKLANITHVNETLIDLGLRQSSSPCKDVSVHSLKSTKEPLRDKC